MIKPSQVINLPVAQSQSSNKDEKGTFTSSSVYSEREMHLLVLTSGRRWVGVRVSEKSPTASHYVYATSLNFPSARSNLRACRIRRKSGRRTRPKNLAWQANYGLLWWPARTSHRSRRSGIIVQAMAASSGTWGAFSPFLNGGALCSSQLRFNIFFSPWFAYCCQ